MLLKSPPVRMHLPVQHQDVIENTFGEIPLSVIFEKNVVMSQDICAHIAHTRQSKNPQCYDIFVSHIRILFQDLILQKCSLQYKVGNEMQVTYNFFISAVPRERLNQFF